MTSFSTHLIAKSWLRSTDRTYLFRLPTLLHNVLRYELNQPRVKVIEKKKKKILITIYTALEKIQCFNNSVTTNP